jgi:nickel-dependent lactate racemase
MIYYQKGSVNEVINSEELKEAIYTALEKLGKKKKVLAIPPDFTRFHSRAGEITRYIWEYYGKRLTDILPAIGTHSPMTKEEINTMFGNIPDNLFRIHDWRNNIVTLGIVPENFISEISENKVNYPWMAQVNKLLVEGSFDLILSVGQVVPHEVSGMANYNKNIFIGTGGSEGINKSHFLGAVYGMERMMGKSDTPVRKVLNYASKHFSGSLPPVIYFLTVIGKDNYENQVIKGLFFGDDTECFHLASELSRKVNLEIVDNTLTKVVVYLNPEEYKSTWLGNKSIYRTRMAIADNGELIILAPGLKTFGEDTEIDRLIRKYGYRGTPSTLQAVKENEELRNNLSAAAHLIHGSSENRFRITYCPGSLSEKEIKNVNFNYADPATMIRKYNPEKLSEGINILPDGEEIFFISNPALGLWAYKNRFNNYN